MLKIQTDRVIIDGHEPTTEQCETMTLLANALAKSNNFKTVAYRDGYAEFEKVGKADELKFKPGGFRVAVDLTTLPGWEGLTTGSHNITVVAKAAGYRDSEPSAGVSVEKTAPASLYVGEDIIIPQIVRN